jgi:hypothetical protein
VSNALAIAATTAVIKNLLERWLASANLSAINSATVSVLPPDRLRTGEGETSQLNLFMYHAVPNAGWRNVNLPAYNSQGERGNNPPLGVDLHYLMSAYGSADYASEILLGLGMQLLHEIPILTQDLIRRTFTASEGGSLSDVLQLLSNTGIAEQLETIKISPMTLNTEEMSRLWSAFQVPYRPTAAYQVSVLLIESRRSFKAALPVRQPQIYVLPFRQPVIETVEPQILAPVAAATLTLRGINLKADNTVVRFGAGGERPPGAETYTDTEIQVGLPSTVQAGINTVQVIQRLLIGEPTLHNGFESNVMAFTLRPAVSKRTVDGSEVYNIELTNVQGTGTTPRSGIAVVGVTPAVGQKQEVLLLLNELNPPADRAARAYTFAAPSRDRPPNPPTSESIRIPIQRVLPGTYLVRVRVGGAESLLDLDANNLPIAPVLSIA